MLNGALMVEVPPPFLMNVPALFTAAVVPSSATPRLIVEIVRAVVVASVNVAPFRIVSVPEPASLRPVLGLALFKPMLTLDPFAVLAPPSFNVRPPSSPKPVEVNVAPFCAIVVPEPLCVPPEKFDAVV